MAAVSVGNAYITYATLGASYRNSVYANAIKPTETYTYFTQSITFTSETTYQTTTTAETIISSTTS